VRNYAVLLIRKSAIETFIPDSQKMPALPAGRPERCPAMLEIFYIGLKKRYFVFILTNKNYTVFYTVSSVCDTQTETY